jgi:hypothetical protein
LRDNPQENVCYNQHPYPQDDGYGQCVACFGDPILKAEWESRRFSEDDMRRMLGSTGVQFHGARIQQLRETMKPANVAKLDAMDYEEQVITVIYLIDKGVIT